MPEISPSPAGGDKWNRPPFWHEIAELVEPGARIVDRRKNAFADDEGEDLAHPADVMALAQDTPEARARTGQGSSAALLLRDAADDFRCVVLSMVGDQQILAVQLCKQRTAGSSHSLGGPWQCTMAPRPMSRSPHTPTWKLQTGGARPKTSQSRLRG